jgi:colanic acid biosynthesis glycosyl transferase WcaI
MTRSPHPKSPSALNGRRVVIAGINYWPEETGNAPYTTGLAEHLAARGAGVTVLTGMPYYPQWRVPREYAGKLWVRERQNGVNVLRLRQYVPHEQSAIRRGITEATYLAHAVRLARLPLPDVVLGVMPMVSGGAIAAATAARYRVPFGLLIQDLSGQAASQTGIKGGGSVARATGAIEGWIARRATGIAIVAEGFRHHLEEMGVDPTRIRRVRNWTHIQPPTSTPAETRARLGLPADAWICLHAGNMGLKQGLENIVDTARIAQDRHPNLLFVFVGDGNQRSFLEERAAGLSNVRFLPPQPEEVFADALAAADVLLVNQRPSVIDMCLPGKLTSYLSVARPVVAAVAQSSETARELTGANAGVVVDAGQPEQLLTALTRLESDRSWAMDLGKRGQSFAFNHLTADAALRTMEGFISDIADRRTAAPSGAWVPQEGD